ncbi:hypothetical protein P692DRAFT_20954547, partial [Suillus brevipes Sb2]
MDPELRITTTLVYLAFDAASALQLQPLRNTNSSDGSLCQFIGDGARNGRARPLGGVEHVQDILNRHLKGDQTLFFGLTIDLHDPVDITKLGSSAQECWSWLRFQVPTIASSIIGSDHELPVMTYTTASPEEISQWVQRTFIIHSSYIDLDELRVNEGMKEVPSSDGDHTWMHLVLGEIANGAVSQFGLLFHTHHSPFDGAGLKIIMNCYIIHLVKVLSDSSGASESIEWGNELENLPSSAYSILNSNEPLPVSPDSPEEPSFDHEYYKSFVSVLSGFGAAAKDTYGFSTRPKDTEWPKTRRAEAVFTMEESAAIQSASKISGYTLTHLAHAALAMVIIADNPPNQSSSPHFMNNVSLANFRSQLDPNHALHPGYVLGVFMTRIPVSAFLSPDGSVLPLDRDVLLRVAEIALPPNQCFSFSSEGKGENYLNRIFADDAGKPVLEVTKFFTSLNRFDPGPRVLFFLLLLFGSRLFCDGIEFGIDDAVFRFFRLSSWG